MTASRAAISVSFRLLNSGMPLSVAIAFPSEPSAGGPAAVLVVVASAGGVEVSLILLPLSDECGCGTGDTNHARTASYPTPAREAPAASAHCWSVPQDQNPTASARMSNVF